MQRKPLMNPTLSHDQSSEPTGRKGHLFNFIKIILKMLRGNSIVHSMKLDAIPLRSGRNRFSVHK
jgi:hypothetical protein